MFSILVVLMSVSVAPAAASDANDPITLVLQVIDSTEDPTTQAAMLAGMVEGLRGQRNVKPPANWATVYPKLRESSDATVRRMAGQLAQIFGDRDAFQEAIETVRNTKAPVALRREAFRSLLTQQRPELAGLLPHLLEEKLMRTDAIRAYASFNDKTAPARLLKSSAQWSTDERRVVIETLASRKTYARALIRAIHAGKVSKRDVPAYVARNLQQMLGSSFTEVWGEVKAANVDKAKLISQYKKRLSDDHLANGSVSNGRAVFARTCAACHTLFGAGGKVGPDITGSNRANLDYILYQILDPNDDVPDAYRLVIVTTVDGKVLNGRIAEEDPRRLVLETAEGPAVILKQDIDERKRSKLSLMPEGLLEPLKDPEVRDLILYLRSNKQVSLPKLEGK